MISVKETKRIREHLNCTHIVIFGVDENGNQHVATHGETAQNAIEAAKAGNNLKEALGWDSALCRSMPVTRNCKNCFYYKPDYGHHCMNGWSQDGSTGHCEYEIENIATDAESKCHCFQPKV